jgi:phosphoglycerate dehydrogenase-like enzyme
MITTVVVYHPAWATQVADLLRQREPSLDVRVAPTAADLEQHLGEAHALLTSPRVPLEPLARAPNLRWIQLMSAGADWLLQSSDLSSGVRLTRLVGTFGPRMAEYAFAHVLAISQQIQRAAQQQREHRWEPFHQWWLLGRTLLLVGVGEIGRAVGRVGQALGMKIIGVARRPRPLRGVSEVFPVHRLREALAQAHLIVVTLPLTPQTRGLFGAAEFAAMRQDAVFLNMGRGAVVGEQALADALRQGRPAWAVLDVFEREPLPPDSPLWDLPNAVITPHVAGHTLPAEAVEAFCVNLARWRAGRRLRHVVHRQRGY